MSELPYLESAVRQYGVTESPVPSKKSLPLESNAFYIICHKSDMNKNSQSVTQILDNLSVKDLKITTDFLPDSAYRRK